MNNKPIIFMFIMMISSIYYIKQKYLLNITIFKSIYDSIYYGYIKPKFTYDPLNIPIFIQEGCKNIIENLNKNIQITRYIKNTEPMLYIVNHQTFLDPIIIKSIYPDVVAIAKHDSSKDFFLSDIVTEFLDNYGTILYKRGDKTSGSNVRKLIADTIIKNKKSVLVFPEGGSYAFGGPYKFFPGSFEVAKENNIKIQPITLIYDNNIAWAKKHPLSETHNNDIFHNLNYLSNTETKCYITCHSIIDPSNFETGQQIAEYCHNIIKYECLNKNHYQYKNKLLTTNVQTI